MKLIRNLVVVLTTLTLVGLIRLPYDDRVARDLRKEGLLPEPIKLDTREELGQTGLAIALGGLRPLIASMLNLETVVHWENQEWYELEQTYNTIVALQPRIRYYWRTGAWHLHSNAYADFSDKPGLSEGRRKRRQREFFDKGIAFLERGVEANPHDWRLWSELGTALSTSWRPTNLNRAAEAYRRGFEQSGALRLQRQHVYVLSRLPGREEEAWTAAQEMWAQPANRRYRSPSSIYFALQHRAGEDTATVEDIFGDRLEAAMDLPDYWFRQEDGYPMDGVAELLGTLGKEFGIPPQFHPLRFPPDKVFYTNPYTGESFGIRPKTGERRERTWRSIWMNRPRDVYRQYLRNVKEKGRIL